MRSLRLRRSISKLYEEVMVRLPGQVAARIDYLRPTLRDSWGGPLNGQQGRQSMVREIVLHTGIQAIVETGTFRGVSTEFFSHLCDGPVRTVELHSRYYHYALTRLRHCANVTVSLGDARAFLEELSRSTDRSTRTLFYLDAHWNSDLPLLTEIGIISAHWENAVIIIDDFQVADDSGYGFDDYGPSGRLTIDFIADAIPADWRTWYPERPSAKESGARRGSIVLASASFGASLDQVTSLRPVPQATAIS